jgi:putative SOS response-associated peptidase YedK
MCNLYSMTTTQAAMRQLFAHLPFWDLAGNLPVLPAIYPDMAAPIIRCADDGVSIVMGRWGMPTPPGFLAGKKTDRGVTNIRNTASPHWRRWLGVAHRCLVPMTTFAEPDGGGGNAWFAMADERPAFFAGMWTPWTSVRKLKDGETTDDLFGFLTTTPNHEVTVVHPKAMPVILTEPAAWEAWLRAPWADAAGLQRALPDGSLKRLA